MRVLVDMDGVLTDLVGSVKTEMQKQLPGIAWQEPTQYWFARQYPEGVEEEIVRIIHEPGFFHNLQPIQGAVAGFKELATIGDVRIVTHPSKTASCIWEKIAWVEEHLGAAWVEKMTFTYDRSIMEADYLIDDNPTVYRTQRPRWQQIIFDQSYNRQAGFALRMEGWARQSNIWATFREKSGLPF